MGRRSWGMLAWGVLAAQPMAAVAQQLTAAPLEVGGSPASDLVSVSTGVPTVPLRHGGLIARSERVYLNGQALTSGVDYSIDYDSGVVYLLHAARAGQTVNVTYRYTPGKTTAPSTFGNGINTFQLSLLPGALNMRFGFGLAERSTDGTVHRSNIYGFNTNYSFGMLGSSSALNGLLLFGNRQEVASASDYEVAAKKQANPQGQSRLVLENLQTKIMGGTAALDFQDVSNNFTGFSAAQGSGYDQKVLDQLQKEKGLTRMGYGLTDLGVGGLKLSNSFHEVKDPTSTISWKTLGLKEGPFAIGWSSQQVGKTFSRFGDLGEANHADLQREIGTKRDTTTLGFNLKGGAISATQFDLTDQTGAHLHRHEAALTGKSGALSYGDSSVEKEFTGFTNLLDPEKAAYGLDGGLRRQWASAKLDPGHGAKQFLASEYTIKSDAGKFRAEDLSLGGKVWNFGYSDRSSDAKFASFGSINPADTDANINAIGAMYPGVKPNAPGERGAFAATPGLDRRDFTFGLTPTKISSLSVNQLVLDGAKDKGKLDNVAITAGGLVGAFKYEDIGLHFDELPSLLGFEKGVLGPIEGLKKTDINVTDNLGHNHVVTFNQMVASTPAGAAGHEQLEYKDRQLDVNYQSRAVDPNFASVGQLVDPQAGLLNSLIGFKQSDTKVNWAPGKGMSYAGEYASSHNDLTGVSTLVGATDICLAFGRTTFGYSQHDQQSSDPLHLILENDQESMSLKQVLGNWTFHTGRTKVDFGGAQEVDSANNPLQSYVNNTVGLEVKVSKTTSVASELVTTEFANGQQASVRTDSVSTAITPRAGITVSNTQLDNNADKQVDETKRNYGFWYDITKGVRVSYGYVRDLNSSDTAKTGTLNSVLTVGSAPTGLTGDGLGKVNQGAWGDLALGGGYAANQWQTPNATTGLESTRTQSFSNIRINTVKPLALGALKELKFQVNTDTATDNFTWIRQNQELGFTGKLGQAAFGFDYHAQIDAQNEHSADRTYTFATDPSEKRFITGSALYKIRTLPAGKDAMIRNFDLKMHVNERLTLSNQLLTNPDVANPNVILGSVTQGTQVNRYKADFKSTKDVSFGGSWEELKDSGTKAYGQTTAVNMSLFNSANPLILSYGWQTLDGNVPRQTIQRWSIKFDEKAGPNQSFNFMVGSLSYGFNVPTGQPVHGLTAQLGYQYRF